MTIAPPRSVRASLESSAHSASLTMIAVSAIVAAVASSRAAHHTLAPVAVVGLVGAWAAVLASIGWVQGVHNGAADVLAGRIVFADEPLPGPRWVPDRAALVAEGRYGTTDGFSAGRIWRFSVLAGVTAGAWSLAGAGLVAAVLDGRQAPWIVVAAALAGLSGASFVVVDLVARRHGMAAARRALATPPPRAEALPRRAWRQVALPLAAIQAAVNAGGAWLLFHSYRRPAGIGVLASGPVLTARVALADAIAVVIVVGVLTTQLAGTWGAVDATLGRVEVGSAKKGSRPLGVHAVLYVGAIAVVMAKLGEALLPKAPNLIEVAVARGLLGGIMVLATAGFGYVRGALNASCARAREVVR